MSLSPSKAPPASFSVLLALAQAANSMPAAATTASSSSSDSARRLSRKANVQRGSFLPTKPKTSDRIEGEAAAAVTAAAAAPKRLLRPSKRLSAGATETATVSAVEETSTNNSEAPAAAAVAAAAPTSSSSAPKRTAAVYLRPLAPGAILRNRQRIALLPPEIAPHSLSPAGATVGANANTMPLAGVESTERESEADHAQHSSTEPALARLMAHQHYLARSFLASPSLSSTSAPEQSVEAQRAALFERELLRLSAPGSVVSMGRRARAARIRAVALGLDSSEANHESWVTQSRARPVPSIGVEGSLSSLKNILSEYTAPVRESPFLRDQTKSREREIKPWRFARGFEKKTVSTTAAVGEGEGGARVHELSPERTVPLPSSSIGGSSVSLSSFRSPPTRRWASKSPPRLRLVHQSVDTARNRGSGVVREGSRIRPLQDGEIESDEVGEAKEQDTPKATGDAQIPQPTRPVQSTPRLKRVVHGAFLVDDVSAGALLRAGLVAHPSASSEGGERLTASEFASYPPLDATQAPLQDDPTPALPFPTRSGSRHGLGSRGKSRSRSPSRERSLSPHKGSAEHFSSTHPHPREFGYASTSHSHATLPLAGLGDGFLSTLLAEIMPEVDRWKEAERRAQRKEAKIKEKARMQEEARVREVERKEAEEMANAENTDDAASNTIVITPAAEAHADSSAVAPGRRDTITRMLSLVAALNEPVAEKGAGGLSEAAGEVPISPSAAAEAPANSTSNPTGRDGGGSFPSIVVSSVSQDPPSLVNSESASSSSLVTDSHIASITIEPWKAEEKDETTAFALQISVEPTAFTSSATAASASAPQLPPPLDCNAPSVTSSHARRSSQESSFSPRSPSSSLSPPSRQRHRRGTRGSTSSSVGSPLSPDSSWLVPPTPPAEKPLSISAQISSGVDAIHRRRTATAELRKTFLSLSSFVSDGNSDILDLQEATEKMKRREALHATFAQIQADREAVKVAANIKAEAEAAQLEATLAQQAAEATARRSSLEMLMTPGSSGGRRLSSSSSQSNFKRSSSSVFSFAPSPPPVPSPPPAQEPSVVSPRHSLVASPSATVLVPRAQHSATHARVTDVTKARIVELLSARAPSSTAAVAVVPSGSQSARTHSVTPIRSVAPITAAAINMMQGRDRMVKRVALPLEEKEDSSAPSLSRSRPRPLLSRPVAPALSATLPAIVASADSNPGVALSSLVQSVLSERPRSMLLLRRLQGDVSRIVSQGQVAPLQQRRLPQIRKQLEQEARILATRTRAALDELERSTQANAQQADVAKQLQDDLAFANAAMKC